MFYKGLLYSIIYIPCKGIPNLVRRQNSGGKKGKRKSVPVLCVYPALLHYINVLTFYTIFSKL